VVSALSGLRDVVVEAQTSLLDAAVKAEVPRSIPSDYSIDFTKPVPGGNRNLDLRRDFHLRLDKAPIVATTIFNGAFADLLTCPAPIIFFKLRRVVYWGDASQRTGLHRDRRRRRVHGCCGAGSVDASFPLHRR